MAVRSGRALTVHGDNRCRACVGVAENGNEAVLVTIDADRRLVDRRQVQLTRGLPTHPHHHQGSWAVGRYLGTPGARAVTLHEAVALVERVRLHAHEGARASLDALASVTAGVDRIALRWFPPLPATIEARIADARVQTYADSAMYRQALADAAVARAWSVHWYAPGTLREQAVAAVHPLDLDALLGDLGRTAGPPWTAAQKRAAMAALAYGRNNPL